jgi:hypothetical protein
MGWWRIDPATGKPARESSSKLSRPPNFVLLNAVPGVDDEQEAHYLGDGPWDMAYLAVQRIRKVLGARQPPTAEEARGLFLNRAIPASLGKIAPRLAARLLEAVVGMWKSVDGCYEDDWERAARPAERRWVAEYAVKRLTTAEPDEAED